MRFVLVALMAVHGMAHLVGFVGSWNLGPPSPAMPYKTTVLAGHVNLGDVGIRAVGLLWLVAAMAFVITAVGAAVNAEWWMRAAMVVTLGSLALTVLEWPQARVGFYVDIAILGALLLV
jgi:hypothetical protein